MSIVLSVPSEVTSSAGISSSLSESEPEMLDISPVDRKKQTDNRDYTTRLYETVSLVRSLSIPVPVFFSNSSTVTADLPSRRCLRLNRCQSSL